MNDVERTLEERGSRYGDSFITQFTVAQNIKNTFKASPNWERLTPEKREALEIIATKISRVLCGDQNYADNWHDIAGYSLLIERSVK